MKILEKRTKFQRVIFTIVFVLFTIYAISLLYPFIWAFYNSMKTRDDYIRNSFNLPATINFLNYIEVFNSFTVSTTHGDVGFVQMFINSLLFVSLSTFLAVIGSACAAYIIAKFKFFGSKFIYSAAVFIMIVPTIGLTPALYSMLSKVNLTDNLVVTAMITGGCFGMYFMLMYATFESLSWTYAEAGYIDGANDFVVFFRIMMPQVMGQTLALCLVCAIGIWNDYFNPYVFMRNIPTISTGLYYYQGNMLESTKRNYPLFFSALLLCCLPMLILFVCFQNTLMNNTSAGGIKG